MMLRRLLRIPRDLIGKRVAVVSSRNKSLEGIAGTAVDETRSTVVISTEEGEKTVLKAGVVLDVEGERIDGRKLMRRPEDR